MAPTWNQGGGRPERRFSSIYIGLISRSHIPSTSQNAKRQLAEIAERNPNPKP